MKRAHHHILFCKSVRSESAPSLGEGQDRPRTPSPAVLLASWNGELDEDVLEALTEALRPPRHEVS